ncbi:hypothetical protein ACIA5D_50550 [Actinoplanes sp. NPDC051513]|uniref:hypothetical protein n=1 Tax=Actinoplanes sp. NPDC051513 TaxID=3363908 RepID=UPI0037A31F58
MLPQDHELRAVRPVKERIEDDLLRLPGVVGVDIGLKRVAGQPTDTVAIRVLVVEKRDVDDAERVPETINGIATDVIQTGPISFLTCASPALDQGRYDPLVGGISIGTRAGPEGVGTLGCILQANGTGQLLALSNWHVLVGGVAGALSVIQPGPGDGGNSPGDIIGQVSRSAINENVDAAVVPISARAALPLVNGVGRIAGWRRAAIGDRVKKHGRSSGTTWGDVDTVDATISLIDGGVNRVFRRQIAVWRADGVSSTFVCPGDSGSAVVIAYSNQVVGLLFAGGGGNPFFPDGALAYCNPIVDVLYAMDATVYAPKTKEKDKDKDHEKLGGEKAMKEQDVQLAAKLAVEAALVDPVGEAYFTAEQEQGSTSAPMAERLARLEASVNELRHFIRPQDRDEPIRPQMGDDESGAG